MTETKFDLNISKDMNLLELSTKHVDGNLYFVKTKKNWVADNDSIYVHSCLLYTSPSPRDGLLSRMPSSA